MLKCGNGDKIWLLRGCVPFGVFSGGCEPCSRSSTRSSEAGLVSGDVSSLVEVVPRLMKTVGCTGMDTVAAEADGEPTSSVFDEESMGAALCCEAVTGVGLATGGRVTIVCG